MIPFLSVQFSLFITLRAVIPKKYNSLFTKSYIKLRFQKFKYVGKNLNYLCFGKLTLNRNTQYLRFGGTNVGLLIIKNI